LRTSLESTIKEYCKGALRVIGVAYKDLKPGEGGDAHEDIAEGEKVYDIEKEDLVLLAFAGIKDIIREEVPSAVQKCNVAGVRVRMVTGDNVITAIAIAKECGIITEGEEEGNPHVCMEGEKFHEFVGGIVNKNDKKEVKIIGKDKEVEIIGNLANMKIVRQNLKVLARSRPADKYVMVSGLR
jgi:Ca2+ transporting ATPase